MMLDNKRGLSMVFVIAGVAIVVIAALVVFFASEDVQVGRRISTTQIESVREYIEGCVKDRVENKIKDLRIYGGEESTDVPSTSYFYNEIPYNVLLESNEKNNLNSLVNVQDILASDLLAHFKDNNGCPLDPFKNNFVINDDRDNINFDVNIFDFQINVNLIYPITVERGETKTELERFNVIIEDNLGYILEPLVLDIINGYIADESFDLLGYCADMGYYCDPINSGSGEKRIDIYRSAEDYQNGNVESVFRFVVVT